MTNHFTTPEFADVLKQHGIDIDTPFYWYLREVYAIHELDNGEIIAVNIDNKERVSHRAKRLTKNYVPAYLLSQVLGWLPEQVTYRGSSWDIMPSLWRGALELGLGEVEEMTFVLNFYVDPMPIEQLITQGLTEGWLTKEIIEQQIKQNQ